RTGGARSHHDPLRNSSPPGHPPPVGSAVAPHRSPAPQLADLPQAPCAGAASGFSPPRTPTSTPCCRARTTSAKPPALPYTLLGGSLGPSGTPFGKKYPRTYNLAARFFPPPYIASTGLPPYGLAVMAYAPLMPIQTCPSSKVSAY